MNFQPVASIPHLFSAECCGMICSQGSSWARSAHRQAKASLPIPTLREKGKVDPSYYQMRAWDELVRRVMRPVM